MKKLFKNIVIFGLVLFVLISTQSYAVSVYSTLFKLVQPDGTEFLARAYGDEWSNGVETASGYTILLDPASNYWVYALRSPFGDLYSSGLIVGKSDPSGFEKHIRVRSNIRRAPGIQSRDFIKGKKVTGDLPVLVILVEFKNQKLVGSNISNWQKQFFGTNKSVKDYYKEVSYNQLLIVPAAEKNGKKNDGIVLVKLNSNHPNPQGNTGDLNRQITKSALIAADKFVNYAKFDMNKDGAVSVDEALFVIVCAGYETAFGGSDAKTPSVWGHKWTLWGAVSAPTLDGVKVGDFYTGGGYTQFGEWHALKSVPGKGNIATIGIMCHEIGHDAAGLPDLYDTDGTSVGIGNWGLMGGGSWNRTNLPGDSPAHFMGWAKYFMGWIKPIILKGGNKKITLKQIEKSKKKSLYLVKDNPNGAEFNNGKGEYFLLENRQQTGYDIGLPGNGLLIWHIDEKQSNNASEGTAKKSHRLVDLEQADGKKDLDGPFNRGDEGDPFPGSSKNKNFNKSTNPSSKWYGGKDSKLKISNISGSKASMKAKVSVSK